MVTKEQIIEEIKKIQDPEIGIDIWTLGLIYDIRILDEKNAHILMTFTSPMCPAGGLLTGKVTEYVKDLGFEKVDVEVTFEPAWQPSAELRAMLGI